MNVFHSKITNLKAFIGEVKSIVLRSTGVRFMKCTQIVQFERFTIPMPNQRRHPKKRDFRQKCRLRMLVSDVLFRNQR